MAWRLVLLLITISKFKRINIPFIRIYNADVLVRDSNFRLKLQIAFMESIFPSTRSDCTWVLSRFLSAIINTYCQSNPLKLFFCYESCLYNIVFKDKFRIIVNPFTIIHFLSDHSLTMLAGLGTLGFEILEQCDCNLDAVVVPGSDANLLRALRYSIKRIFPQIKVMVSEDINRSETSHCFNTVSLVWYAKYSSWGRKSQGKRVCKRYVEYIASPERGNM